MSRKSVTYGLNALKKTARSHPDPDINRIVNDIYAELNALNDAVNLQSGSYTASPGEGKDGDIRLYKGTGYDGSEGYFIQGKFNDGWGTAQLTLETKNPDVAEVSDTTNAGGTTFSSVNALLSDINYNNLNTNAAVGFSTNKVAPGADGGVAINLHWKEGETISMRNNVHFPLSDTDPTATAPNNSLAEGTADEASRRDHTHTLPTAESTGTVKGNAVIGTSSANTVLRSDANLKVDLSDAYTWGGLHIFNEVVTVNDNVNINGNLSVAYSASDTGNTTLEADVVLNTAGESHTTTIHGNTTIGDTSNSKTLDVWGKVSIKDADNTTAILEITGGDGSNFPIHIKNDSAAIMLERASDAAHRVKFSIDSGSSLTITAGTASDGDIILDPKGQDVRPLTTLTTDLGMYDKKFRSLYCGELIVDTLVAQDVMATIGGRIIVAPTSKLIADCASGSGTIDIKHNNFNTGDFMYLATAPDGNAQFEFLEVTNDGVSITGGYRYSINRDADGAGTPNNWQEGDAVVNYGGTTGDGVIEITANQTVFNTEGPTIAIHARKNTNVVGGAGDYNDYANVVKVGNLDGVPGVSGDKYGIAFGSDLSGTESAFKGVVADHESGVKLYNTDLSLYDGSTLKGELGLDGSSKPHLWLGNSSSVKALHLRNVGSNYKLTLLSTALEIVTGGGADVEWQNSDLTWDTSSFSATIPQYLGAVSGTGTYIGANTVGMYDATSTAGWPVVIHNDSGVGKLYAGTKWNLTGSPNTAGASYLYWNGTALNVKGEIHATSGTFADSVTIGGTAASDIVQGAQDGTSANDYLTQGELLSSEILLHGGAIRLGNTAGSAVYSFGTDDFSTNTEIGGFRLGRDTEFAEWKFLIKNAKDDDDDDQQYILVDTTADNDAVTIKGAVYADKLADVTPKIKDAGGAYRPLTIIKSFAQGEMAPVTGTSISDYASEEVFIEGVRNGAMIEVDVTADPWWVQDYWDEGTPISWCNPSVIYRQKGVGSHSIIQADGHTNFHGKELYKDPEVTGPLLRLKDWVQVDYRPHSQDYNSSNETATSHGGMSSMSPFFDIKSAWVSDGWRYFLVTAKYTNYGDISTETLDAGTTNGAGWTQEALKAAFGVGKWIAFRRHPDGGVVNNDYRMICTWPAKVDEVTNTTYGDQPAVHFRLSKATSLVGYERGLYNTVAPSDSRPPHPCRAYSGGENSTGDTLVYQTVGTDDTAVPLSANFPNLLSGGDHQHLQADFNSIWDSTSPIDFRNGYQVSPIQVPGWMGTGNAKAGSGIIPISNAQFKHRYIFKVELPNLHTGDNAGTIGLRFVTGATPSEFRTWNPHFGHGEHGMFHNVDLKVIVHNQG